MLAFKLRLCDTDRGYFIHGIKKKHETEDGLNDAEDDEERLGD